MSSSIDHFGDLINPRRFATLLDAARALPVSEQESFLTQECGDCDDLLARLRDALQEGAQTRPTGPPSHAPPFADVQAWIAGGDDGHEPGVRRFGSYRLLLLLGRGGMGEVHLAERSDGEFEQLVALKLVSLPTPGLIRRFRQERQILARLQHPNIAHLLDGGVGEANIPFYVMEYVDGVPITDYVAEKRLDVAATLALFTRVCDAVQYAHRNLVVHRDIKPSNILVDDNGVPKLLDFGIAKVLEGNSSGNVTGTGLLFFTPNYAAPEQLLGGDVTTATDIYALGVVLYELLTGCKPYRLRRNESLEQAIVHAEPMTASVAAERAGPGSARQRRMRGKLLRGDLDHVLQTALAKEPERRYASAEALKADICNYLDGRPVKARGAGTAYRLRKFLRRHWAGVAVAAAGAITLVTATGFSLWQADIARLQADRAATEAATAEAVQDFMIHAFTQAEPWRNGGRPPNVLDLATSALERIDVELQDQPLAKVRMYRTLGRLFRVAGDVRDSARAGQKAVAELEKMPSAAPAELHDARMEWFFSLISTGDYAEARRVLASASAGAPDDEARRLAIEDARALLARASGNLLDYDRLEQSIPGRTAAFYGEVSARTAQARWHAFEAAMLVGHYAAAQTALEQAYAINTAMMPVDAPLRAEVLADQLVVAAKRGMPEAAVTLAERLVARTRRMFGASGDLADSLTKLGRVQHEARQVDAAIATLTEADALLANPGFGNALRRAANAAELGRAWLDAKRPQMALPVLAAALKTYADADDPRGLALRAGLARAAWLLGDATAATQLREFAERARKQQLAELPEILGWLAEAEQGAAAETLWREVLVALEAQGRPSSSLAFDSRRALARLLGAQARAADAQAQWRLALALSITLYDESSTIVEETLKEAAQANHIEVATLLQRARADAAASDPPARRLIDRVREDVAATEATSHAGPG
ncbi:MAG: serine/threonine protein kinase [Proteobacteria bacterium]|nr:serine/threonine protein kinase [Pseudomonadota bacterium]